MNFPIFYQAPQKISLIHKFKKLFLFLVCFVFSFSSFLFADTISGVSGSNAPNIGSGTTVIDFESQANASFSSLTLNSVTFLGVDQNLRTDNRYATASGNTYVGYNCMGVRCLDNNTFGDASSFAKSIRFNFATPTEGFAFNFGASDSIWVLRAYNNANQLLGSVNIPAIQTSNAGDYFGLRFANSNISYATLIDSDLCNSHCSWGDWIFIDNFVFFSGPSSFDTQSSMRYQASQLRSAFNTQTVAANFALNYDCNVFDVKGMCISAGGRYTTIDNPNINNSAAVVTLGYKVNPNIRMGGYLDQNINISNPTGINISNNTPLMGLYAVWNKEQSGLGYQVRLANTYQDKDVTSTRTVFDTSEAGSGKSSLTSQSYLAELSYAFQYQDKMLVRPYAGLRYTHLKQKGYTEDTTDTVTDPLTVAALRDKGTTALLGLKINRSLTDKATLTAQLGLEQDLYHKVDQYSATDLNGSDLTAIAFNSNIKRTRPVASIGAFYDVTKTQRASATINYQQTAFQSTGSATAYFNYMIGF
jgi:hypothetical protein